MSEYQARTAERLIEILRAQDENPRSWQQEAAQILADRLAAQSAAPGGSQETPQPVETPEDVLNGIRDALESRGFFHMANGRDIGLLLDDPLPAQSAAPGGEPVAWPNGSNETVPQALRYLADHPRPAGGEQKFNAMHLYQLADEIEQMASRPLYAAQSSSSPAAPTGDTQSGARPPASAGMGHRAGGEAAQPHADGVREVVKAAVTAHCHVNMKWPATAQIDDSHIDAFLAQIALALSDGKKPAGEAQGVLDFDLVEVVAMGICAKTAIKNGGGGHGCWWELGTEAKDGFRDIARSLLAALSVKPGAEVGREEIAQIIPQHIFMDCDFDECSPAEQKAFLRAADAILALPRPNRSAGDTASPSQQSGGET